MNGRTDSDGGECIKLFYSLHQRQFLSSASLKDTAVPWSRGALPSHLADSRRAGCIASLSMISDRLNHLQAARQAGRQGGRQAGRQAGRRANR